MMGNKKYQKDEVFTVATFNVRGLADPTKRNSLSKDIKNYNVDICCLQETKIVENIDITLPDGNRFVNINSESKHYGNGFFIFKKFTNYVYSYWKISDRICVLQLKTAKSKARNTIVENNRKKVLYDHVINIINIYAPTSERAQKYPRKTEEFYEKRNNTLKDLRKLSTSIVFIAGDFNAKVGKPENTETCIGRWTTGTRNNNGMKLVQFCENNKLHVCNSSFAHKACHRTTWSGQFTEPNGEVRKIYNQIDYILLHKNNIQSMIDARSCSGTETFSDHRIVVTRIHLSWSKMFNNKNQKLTNVSKLNTDKLIHDPTHRENYKK